MLCSSGVCVFRVWTFRRKTTGAYWAVGYSSVSLPLCFVALSGEPSIYSDNGDNVDNGDNDNLHVLCCSICMRRRQTTERALAENAKTHARTPVCPPARPPARILCERAHIRFIIVRQREIYCKRFGVHAHARSLCVVIGVRVWLFVCVCACTLGVCVWRDR